MKSSWLAACAGLLAFTALAPATASAAPAKTLDVVALGDSYGSGTGAGDYLPGTEGTCWRSRNSAAEVIVRTLGDKGVPALLTNVTCSGAATADLSQTFKGQPPQLDALNAGTDLVTLSVGTSDIDFAGYGGSCVVADCSGAATDAVIEKMPAMSKNVAGVLSEIKTRSPRATIVLTGYGSQLTAGPNASGVQLDPICADQFFTAAERTDGNRAARALDRHLRVAAFGSRAHGVDVRFVSPYANSSDLRPEFAGHSLCEAEPSFYRGFDALAPGQEGQEAVLHLNQPGHAALADVVLREVSLRRH